VTIELVKHLMSKSLAIARRNYAPIATGSLVAIGLAAVWHFINDGAIPIPVSNQETLSGITLLLCPSAFMATGVPPRGPWTSDLLILYATIIVLNGLFYCGLAKMFRIFTGA